MTPGTKARVDAFKVARVYCDNHHDDTDVIQLVTTIICHAFSLVFLQFDPNLLGGLSSLDDAVVRNRTTISSPSVLGSK